jgi:hypothetical protein
MEQKNIQGIVSWDWGKLWMGSLDRKVSGFLATIIFSISIFFSYRKMIQDYIVSITNYGNSQWRSWNFQGIPVVFGGFKQSWKLHLYSPENMEGNFLQKKIREICSQRTVRYLPSQWTTSTLENLNINFLSAREVLLGNSSSMRNSRITNQYTYVEEKSSSVFFFLPCKVV